MKIWIVGKTVLFAYLRKLYVSCDLQGEKTIKKEELPKKFSLTHRLSLLSGNGDLVEGSVVQLTGHDHGAQYVARGLGALAETGADDFDRNLGDLGGSSGSAEVVLLHDQFLLRKSYSEIRPEEYAGFFLLFWVRIW